MTKMKKLQYLRFGISLNKILSHWKKIRHNLGINDSIYSEFECCQRKIKKIMKVQKWQFVKITKFHFLGSFLNFVFSKTIHPKIMKFHKLTHFNMFYHYLEQYFLIFHILIFRGFTYL